MIKNEVGQERWLIWLAAVPVPFVFPVMFNESIALMMRSGRPSGGGVRTPPFSFVTYFAADFSLAWVVLASVVSLVGLAFLFWLRRRIPKVSPPHCIQCAHDLVRYPYAPCPGCGSKRHLRRGGGIGAAPKLFFSVCGVLVSAGVMLEMAGVLVWLTPAYKHSTVFSNLAVIAHISAADVLAGCYSIWLMRIMIRLYHNSLYVAMDERQRASPRCEHCGYNLTGNVTGRCPECGTPCKAPTGAGEAT